MHGHPIGVGPRAASAQAGQKAAGFFGRQGDRQVTVQQRLGRAQTGQAGRLVNRRQFFQGDALALVKGAGGQAAQRAQVAAAAQGFADVLAQRADEGALLLFTIISIAACACPSGGSARFSS